MKKTISILFIFVLALSLAAGDIHARGGRGGGGRGGGARPSPSRGPSMSRPSASRPSASRPSASRPSAGRPSPPSRPSAGRPSTPSRPSAGRPSTPSRPSAGAGRPAQRPSQGDLQNFLNLPPGSGATRPGTGRPGGERPGTGRPGAGRPGIEQPIAGRPGVGKPGVGKPGVGKPGVGKPGVGKPGVGKPGRPGNRPGKVDRNRVNVNVRNHYRNNVANLPFRPGWNGWHGSRWHGWHNGRYRPGHWWRWATAGAVTGWIVHGWANPIYYDYGYGGNVYYEGDTVYVDSQPVCSGEEYYEQAHAIVESAPQIDDEQAKEIEWMPLGVFAVVQEGVEDGNLLLQLAVSKEGVIAGALYNESTESTRDVEGMVDKDTQRAAWSFIDGKNADVVMETGIYNLTKDEATVLVHFGAGATQSWTLVRLDEPAEEGAATPTATTPVAPQP